MTSSSARRLPKTLVGQGGLPCAGGRGAGKAQRGGGQGLRTVPFSDSFPGIKGAGQQMLLRAYLLLWEIFCRIHSLAVLGDGKVQVGAQGGLRSEWCCPRHRSPGRRRWYRRLPRGPPPGGWHRWSRIRRHGRSPPWSPCCRRSPLRSQSPPRRLHRRPGGGADINAVVGPPVSQGLV